MLTQQIEKLIREGYLDKYVEKGGRRGPNTWRAADRHPPQGNKARETVKAAGRVTMKPRF